MLLFFQHPDEVSYPSVDTPKNQAERNTEYRARQNVIMEFGYFVGKLDRSSVCYIYKEEVQIPSYISGSLYIKVTTSLEDTGFSIIKELKAADLECVL
jgi:predicted nucleotide-binding protein